MAGSPGRKPGDAEPSQLARCTGRLQRKGRQKEREKESTAEFVTWGREGGGDGTDGSDTGGSEQARAVLWG